MADETFSPANIPGIKTLEINGKDAIPLTEDERQKLRDFEILDAAKAGKLLPKDHPYRPKTDGQCPG